MADGNNLDDVLRVNSHCGVTPASSFTHADTHFVKAFVLQVVHRLAIDVLLLTATFETTATVHWGGRRMTAIRHLHTSEGKKSESDLFLQLC